MKPLYISIHSWIALITNSSSEIFVSANEKTLAMVKDIINKTLKLGDSNKTVDDLFTVNLVYGPLESWQDGGPCEEMDYLSPEGSAKFEEISYESKPEIRIKVVPKVAGADAKQLAEYMSNLTKTFDIEEKYNG